MISGSLLKENALSPQQKMETCFDTCRVNVEEWVITGRILVSGKGHHEVAK